VEEEAVQVNKLASPAGAQMLVVYHFAPNFLEFVEPD
jgi:hypothetical protein